MRLSGRIDALAALVTCRVAAAAPPRPAPDWDRDRAALLALVPEHLREPVAARLAEPYGPDSEPLSSWVTAPSARWAPAPVPGYRLPEALVRWVLAPPRPFWFGHHCGSCGLAVPLFLIPSRDPRPLADVRAFPTCPACGGATSHAANYRPDAPEGRT